MVFTISIFNTAQLPSETVRQYAERLWALARTIGINEEAGLIGKFINGLMPSVKQQVWIHKLQE